MEQNTIYDPYIMQNGLYVPPSALSAPPPAPKIPRQQRRANERRMRKQIQQGLRAGMLKL